MPVVFPYMPTSLSETLSFLTDVRDTPSGEWRDSLRDAVQLLTYSFNQLPETTEAVRQLIDLKRFGTFYVPLWQFMTVVDAGVAAAATSISVNTDADYSSGFAIVWKDDETFEVVTVTAAAGGALTLASGVVATYTGRTLVAPLCVALVDEGATISRTYKRTSLQLTFRRTDNTDLADGWPYEFEGDDPVMSEASFVVIGGGLAGGFNQASDLVDSDFGAYSLEKVGDYSRARLTLNLIEDDTASRWAALGALHYLRGRDLSFFMPTFQRDFEPVAVTNPANGFLSIKQVDDDTLEKLVGAVIRRVNYGFSSLVRYHRVTAAANQSGVTVLTLNAVNGLAWPLDTTVSLCPRVRLDADQITLSHTPNGDGQIVTSATIPAIEVLQ